MAQGTMISLTGVLVPDSSGQYSAFFAEFPEAIASGETEEEAQSNLLQLFMTMLNDRKGEVMKDYIDDSVQYSTKSINMVVV